MPLTQPVKGNTIPGLTGFELLGEINSGHFGRVYRAQEIASGRIWAVKVIEKTLLNKRQKENVLNEVDIMRSLRHPHIIEFKDFVDTAQYFVIVMELMKGGDLFDRIIAQKSFMEEDARLLMQQIATSVNYMHASGVAHRDLKIENVMFLEQGQNIIKLGDFGLAKRIGSATTRTPVGTQKYMAPEIIKGDSYSFSVDVWSLGCLMFILLYGTFPFYNETDKKGNRLVDISEKIKKGYFRFPNEDNDPNRVSDKAKDLITKCLETDPSKRITIPQFLAHPWVSIKAVNNNPLHAPAALRTVDGLVSMRDYFNFGVHSERNRIDGVTEIEDELSDQQSTIHLAGIEKSKLLKKRKPK